MASTRPYIPVANPDTQAFWDGAGRGELMLQRCVVCQAFRHPPSPICHNCLSNKHEWLKASGRGTVFTFVVVRQAPARGWGDRVPYVVAVVALEEGPHYLTNIVGIAPEAVTIGMPVEVMFEELDGTTKLPVFRPR